jgi:hypothetical protein
MIFSSLSMFNHHLEISYGIIYNNFNSTMVKKINMFLPLNIKEHVNFSAFLPLGHGVKKTEKWSENPIYHSFIKDYFNFK